MSPDDLETPTETTEIKKKEFVELVCEASGVKKKEARAAVEATLSIIGSALAEGKALHIPPLGRMVVTKTKDQNGAQVLIARIRRPSTSEDGTASEGLETTGEDG